MKASNLEILEQAEFCKNLSIKLLAKAKEEIKPSQIRDDIKRLRRELMELSHMTEWNYNREG